MRLLSSTTSPFARKIRVLAHELGLTDRLQVDAIVTTVLAPNGELAQHNPLIKIPTLVLESEPAIYDSRVIAEYLQTLANAAPSGPRRFTILRTQALADGILDAAVAVFYENLFRDEALRSAKMLAAQTDKAERGLAALQRDLDEWTDAERFDLGQIAVACALGWLEFRAPLGDVRARFEALFQWFDRVSERASMQTTKPFVP